MTVIIGMDPHKRSATIEVIDHNATALAAGRYGTDAAGYSEMLTATQRFPDRVWAIESRCWPPRRRVSRDDRRGRCRGGLADRRATRGPDVRVTAAYVAADWPDPHADSVVSRLADDSDDAIRVLMQRTRESRARRKTLCTSGNPVLRTAHGLKLGLHEVLPRDPADATEWSAASSSASGICK